MTLFYSNFIKVSYLGVIGVQNKFVLLKVDEISEALEMPHPIGCLVIAIPSITIHSFIPSYYYSLYDDGSIK